MDSARPGRSALGSWVNAATATPDVLLSRPPECWDPATPPAYDEAKQTRNAYSRADVLRVVKGDECYPHELEFTGDHPNHDVMRCRSNASTESSTE